MSRLQPAFSANNARGEVIYDVSQGQYANDHHVANRHSVEAGSQPYIVNPRNVPNVDAFGIAQQQDRNYWKSKTRVADPRAQVVPTPLVNPNPQVRPNQQINPNAHGVPFVDDRNYWQGRTVVQSDDAVVNGDISIGADPQNVPNFQNRFQRKNARADAQPFDASILPQHLGQNNARRQLRGPTPDNTSYWRSKQVVTGEYDDQYDDNYEVQGTQTIQSTINARNQEVSKLDYLRNQQEQTNEARQAVYENVIGHTRVIAKAPQRRVFVRDAAPTTAVPVSWKPTGNDGTDNTGKCKVTNLVIPNVPANQQCWEFQHTNPAPGPWTLTCVFKTAGTVTCTGTQATSTSPVIFHCNTPIGDLCTSASCPSGTSTSVLTCNGCCPNACPAGKFPDCANVCGGPSIKDCKGVCYDPTKGAPANVVDCTGTCGGKAELDCAGVCNGKSELDCKGVCYDPTKGNPVNVLDCKGVCNGPNVPDCKGICGGGNVLDCKGVCGGTSFPDCKGVCAGTSSYDCFGNCMGPGRFDCTGLCYDSSKGGPANVRDCNGTCGPVGKVPANFKDCSGACLEQTCFPAASGFQRSQFQVNAAHKKQQHQQQPAQPPKKTTFKKKNA